MKKRFTKKPLTLREQVSEAMGEEEVSKIEQGFDDMFTLMTEEESKEYEKEQKKKNKMAKQNAQRRLKTMIKNYSEGLVYLKTGENYIGNDIYEMGFINEVLKSGVEELSYLCSNEIDYEEYIELLVAVQDKFYRVKFTKDSDEVILKKA